MADQGAQPGPARRGPAGVVVPTPQEMAARVQQVTGQVGAMAHNLVDDIAEKTKKAFSAEELLKSPQDDGDRLRALQRQLGLSADDIAELESQSRSSTTGRSRNASNVDDVDGSGVGRARSMRGRIDTSPDLRAERHRAAAEEARERAAAAGRMDPPADGAEPEGVTSVPVRRFQQLSTREQIWAIMDDPTSSRAAQIVAGTIMVMILISCVAFVVQTLPEYVNDTSSAWSIIESMCIAVFTLEFSLRVYATPSRLAFFKAPLNIIDFLAIAPFYVELVAGTDGSGSQVIRLIRLVRIFRIFKISRYLPWVRVFTNALSLSLQPLIMLVLIVMIAMVLFSSVIYYAERGEWNEEAQAWIRQTRDGPEISPYQSIPASFWWCIVTMTTVGYGDMFPVTSFGRFVAALASLSGILVVAIPVSVISTNFNGEYAKLLRQREQVKARMLLLKRQFRESKTGLEAVLDEVEDIVTRNTQELEGEVNTLFDQARVELTEELCEIMKMAYERRRQLHLAALAAGKVQSSIVAEGTHHHDQPRGGPGAPSLGPDGLPRSPGSSADDGDGSGSAAMEKGELSSAYNYTPGGPTPAAGSVGGWGAGAASNASPALGPTAGRFGSGGGAGAGRAGAATATGAGGGAASAGDRSVSFRLDGGGSGSGLPRGGSGAVPLSSAGTGIAGQPSFKGSSTGGAGPTATTAAAEGATAQLATDGLGGAGISPAAADGRRRVGGGRGEMVMGITGSGLVAKAVTPRAPLYSSSKSEPEAEAETATAAASASASAAARPETAAVPAPVAAARPPTPPLAAPAASADEWGTVSAGWEEAAAPVPAPAHVPAPAPAAPAPHSAGARAAPAPAVPAAVDDWGTAPEASGVSAAAVAEEAPNPFDGASDWGDGSGSTGAVATFAPAPAAQAPAPGGRTGGADPFAF